jgi:uncharacterized protein
MKIVYDVAKNERNVRERGLSFGLAGDLDWETALVLVDDRKDYGETRYRAFGMIGERLHAVAFTVVEDGIRVISLRKANRREEGKWRAR